MLSDQGIEPLATELETDRDISRDDERILNARRRWLDHTFLDRACPDASIAALDAALFETDMRALRLLDSEDRPTFLALLTIGKSPRDWLPGAYLPVVALRELLRNALLTDYRNPALAAAMKTLGFVQQFGIGVALARKACRDNHNPDPRIEFGTSRVLAAIDARREYVR